MFTMAVIKMRRSLDALRLLGMTGPSKEPTVPNQLSTVNCQLTVDNFLPAYKITLCHPERAKRVEGSTHFVHHGSYQNAKIPRRASLAQDDRSFKRTHSTEPIVNCELSIEFTFPRGGICDPSPGRKACFPCPWGSRGTCRRPAPGGPPRAPGSRYRSWAGPFPPAGLPAALR